MKRVEIHACVRCTELLTDDNWPSFFKDARRNLCRDCHNEYHREYMAKRKLEDDYRLKYNAYFREYNKRDKDE